MALLLVLALRSIREIATELDELVCTFEDDGTLVRLPPPEEEGGSHLFLSHTWRHAQDQCGTIRSLLYTMLPTCRISLDEEDDEDGDEVEERVAQASVFLAFVTTQYVGSTASLQELTAAWRERKPIVVVRGTHTEHTRIALVHQEPGYLW